MRQLVPAPRNPLCISLPNFRFSDIEFSSWNCQCWEYLYHRNQQMLQIVAAPPQTHTPCQLLTFSSIPCTEADVTKVCNREANTATKMEWQLLKLQCRREDWTFLKSTHLQIRFHNLSKYKKATRSFYFNHINLMFLLRLLKMW